MRLLPERTVAFLAAVSLLSAATAFPESETAVAGGLLDQMPPEMEAHLIDPLTIEKSIPFAAGEHLRYKIGWSMFTVARADMKVQAGEFGGTPAFGISLETRTNKFADSFYKVRNQTGSWIARDASRSYQFTARQSEGERERDVVATFDTENLLVHYVNHTRGEEHEPVEILPGTFDPMGIVFFVRSLHLEVGDHLVIPTSNGREFFFTIVRVVDKVKRKFLIGTREAYVLEPDIKDLGGVFKKSKDGQVRFFISADEQRLVLRMESEVAVGKFWAELDRIIP